MHARRRLGRGLARRRRVHGQAERDLPPAGELDIDLGQQRSVDQRAVQRALGEVDAVAGAERVKRMLGAGMLDAGDRQRVDHAAQVDDRPAVARQLAIEEAEVEIGVVRDHRAVADEFQHVLDHVREQRLVGEEHVRQAVDVERLD
ncbi:hypothetical protein QU38_01640, partial [Staphylococcus aureus]